MKIAALIANGVQLAVILLIFYIRGLDLGGIVIGLLFVLMAVPFINTLTIVLDHGALPGFAFGEPRERSMVKREAMRVHYPEDHCPILATGDSAFVVRDLSEGGVCIRAASSTPFKNRITGELRLLCGDPLRFKARVLRRDEGEVVFGFHTPIGTAVLMKEKRIIENE